MTTKAESMWRPIAKAPNQTSVLVCNDCLLGWWAVAIQNALGEWHYNDRGSREVGDRIWTRLAYEPTHWQDLPSIYPIALRRGKASQQ